MTPRPIHPKLRALFELWEAKRRARPMPARADFDVLELKQWLGNLHLIEVVEDGRDFLHRIYGTELAVAFDRDLTGKGMSALPPGVRERVRGDYATVCRSGEPLLIADDPAVQSAAERVEKLILPLSSDGSRVDRLLVGAFAAKAAMRSPAQAVEAAPKPPAKRDRRRNRRVPLQWEAVVEIGADRVACTVLNYSRRGAKLRLEREGLLERPVRVMLGRRGTRRGKVIWQQGGEAGVQFLDRARPRSAPAANPN